jgi:hypothetical protein
MGFRFQRRLKLFPGVRLNFSRGGISTTIGVRGASFTLGHRGAYVNLGIKCFSKGIGGPGCFGPGNTIVQAFQHAIDDITKGPGENKEVVKALRNVGVEFKDVTWSTPFGRGDAFIPKAGRDIERGVRCAFRGC